MFEPTVMVLGCPFFFLIAAEGPGEYLKDTNQMFEGSLSKELRFIGWFLIHCQGHILVANVRCFTSYDFHSC